ncbi:glycosyltransferase family 9 protein [Chitinophaga horti]|uniref:Glycosyltransferase family 9 protein n=1 Tax=Chitinophaga horti TaxID=2920382 RepID=A0ABY6J720_9BACT|nr:glycosyltransferase family 9 protein [Chitinophaga horti]UYQ94091.1 glycosyltransferase family 9 protein [Chitinophaga horti]
MIKPFKKILCIRPDNMGDVLMSQPAISALKSTFGATITLLTSQVGAAIAELLPEIDEVLAMDAAWVSGPQPDDAERYFQLVAQIKAQQFDVAFIFTVYSQNPLPSAMLAYLAGIPDRFAYCRENPYALLTHWIPDPEPHRFIRHQVKRDLDLVATAGAQSVSHQLRVPIDHALLPQVKEKLRKAGANPDLPWTLMHMGASEPRRQYPTAGWISAARELTQHQLIFTGTAAEKSKVEDVCRQTGAVAAAGLFTLKELILVIEQAALLVTVNTAPMHIAAATRTPVLALYAMTNPQHTPWTALSKVLYFDVPEHQRSQNEIVTMGYAYFPKTGLLQANTCNIVTYANKLLKSATSFSSQDYLQLPSLIPNPDAGASRS